LGVSIVVGLVSLVFFVLERLALTDILHGEPDLGLEWRIVSVSFLPILLFHLISVVAAIAALRLARDGRAARVEQGRADEV
jgi:hypothetical protein